LERLLDLVEHPELGALLAGDVDEHEALRLDHLRNGAAGREREDGERAEARDASEHASSRAEHRLDARAIKVAREGLTPRTARARRRSRARTASPGPARRRGGARTSS